MEWVIDADAHVTEPSDVWTSRVPAKYRDVAPRLVRDPKSGRDTWHVGGDHPMVTVGHTATAGWHEPFPAAPRNMDEVPLAAHDAKARLEYLDSIGVWAQVMYPNVGGFGNQLFLSLEDPELKLACVRAYNDWIIEWCSADSRRLLAVAATPFWDVDATVAEVERCAALGHRGVLFTGEPQHFDLPYLGDRHWDPLWSAAQDAALPVSFHIGSADFTKGFSPGRIRAHGIGATYVATSVSLFLENGQQLVDLLTSGVLARFPTLEFVSVESGIGFLPFILEAADYAYGESSMRQERPNDGKPSDYFRRQVYGCYFFEESSPAWVIDAIGPDNILFETDYPHPICLFGNVREKIDAGLAGQPDAVRHKVLWETQRASTRSTSPSCERALLAISARYGAFEQMRSEVGDMRGAGSSTIRRLTVVVVALLLMATVGAPAAGAASAPVAAGKWATAVCAGLDRWQRALGGRSSKGQNVNDPAAVKATLTKYLDGVVRDTGGLLKRLKVAGVPKVAHGKQIAAALRAEFAKARSIFSATRRRVKRLDVTDKTAFANGVAAAEKGATVAFTTAQVALAKLGTRYPAPALDAALKNAAACRALA